MKNKKVKASSEAKLIDNNSSLNLVERLSFTLLFGTLFFSVFVGVYKILSSIVA